MITGVWKTENRPKLALPPAREDAALSADGAKVAGPDAAAAKADEAFRVHDDTPIEQLLGSDGLRSLGALMVVDSEDRLRGVVTLEQVRRALTAAVPGSAG